MSCCIPRAVFLFLVTICCSLSLSFELVEVSFLLSTLFACMIFFWIFMIISIGKNNVPASSIAMGVWPGNCRVVLAPYWKLLQFGSLTFSLVPATLIHMWLSASSLCFPPIPIWPPFPYLWILYFLFLPGFPRSMDVSFLLRLLFGPLGLLYCLSYRRGIGRLLLPQVFVRLGNLWLFPGSIF